MLSAYEIAILAFIGVVAVWLSLGSPGSMSILSTVFSPFDYVMAVSREMDRVSKDLKYPMPVRILASAIAKIGFGFFIVLFLCFLAIVLYLVFKKYGRLLLQL